MIDILDFDLNISRFMNPLYLDANIQFEESFSNALCRSIGEGFHGYYGLGSLGLNFSVQALYVSSISVGVLRISFTF